MCNTTFKFEHQKYTKINTLFFRDTKGNLMLDEFSLPHFKYLYNNEWLAFEKVDGTNMSYYWDGHTLEIHGKSEDAQIPKPLLEKMQNILPIEVLKEKFPPKFDENGNEIPFLMIIYGEGYGKGIQKCGGKYIANDVDFTVFDIKIGNWWLEWDAVVDICHNLNLKHVEPFGVMTLGEAEKLVIGGFKSPIAEDKELMSEGLVLRPLVQTFTRKGERVMVKVKTKDYKKFSNELIKERYGIER